MSFDQERILNSLKDRNPEIRSTALNEIYKFVQKKNTDNDLDINVTLHILKTLEDEQTDVGGLAIKILSIDLQNKLENPNIKNVFKSKVECENDVIKIRFYEVAINLAKTSQTLLIQLRDVLEIIFKELDSDDILFQMNLLELLASLSEQNYGFVFMEEKNCLNKLASRIENIERDPLVQLVVPGYIKFFGKVAYHHPRKIIEGYPKIISYLFKVFDNIEESSNILPVALDALGNLAHSSEGKIVLDEIFSEQIKTSLENFFPMLKNIPTQMICRTFLCLEFMLLHEGPSNNRIDLITKKWCSSLMNSDYDLGRILEYCKNPFPEIKASCLNFVKTICSYRWGIEMIKNTANLFELLLNRSIEFDKDIKYIKYKIISILAESDLFDVSTNLQLKRYVAEGPYFVEPIMDIAVD